MKLSSSILKGKVPYYISVVLIFLFVYASVSKLLEFEDFKNQLAQSPILSAFANIVAYGIIFLELGVTILLVFDKTRKIGLYMSYTLMVMFTMYIIIILNFSSFIPCSCGGVLENLNWTQHLIFNVVFVLLACWAIFSIDQQNLKKTLSTVLLLLAMSSGAMILVFMSSDGELKHNNAFQRKYIPHELKEIGSYQLESNSFYIAGIADRKIYMGNYNAPLYLKVLDYNLKHAKDIKIEIDNYDLPFKRVRIEVKPPYFMVGDGTIPVLFKGNITNWKAKTYSNGEAFFYQFITVDTINLILATASSRTHENVLGVLSKKRDTTELELHPSILKKQIDGTFDTDGMLLYNQQTKEVIYVYYYRNQFEVTDRALNFKFTGKTIDTVSRAILNITKYKDKGQSKLGQALLVNRYADTYGDFLFINSDRLGKYEDEAVLKSAAIIDQYTIHDNSYKQSFYFYHQNGEKLREFKVLDDFVVGLVNDKLWVYQIKTEHL